MFLRDHTTDEWVLTYAGDYKIVSFPDKTHTEVVNSTGKTKLCIFLM